MIDNYYSWNLVAFSLVSLLVGGFGVFLYFRATRGPRD
jgi:hypothetical protein